MIVKLSNMTRQQELSGQSYPMIDNLPVYGPPNYLQLRPGLKIPFINYATQLKLEQVFAEKIEDMGDYYCYRRLKGLEESDSDTIRIKYKRSKHKYKYQQIVNAKRWKAFSPGRFWATSPTGVYLNRSFVRGSGAWRTFNSP